MCQITTYLHEYPKKHGLSIEWIADTIGVSVSTLQRYLNPNDTLPFPLKLVIPFIRACNNDFSALDLLESRLGRTAIEIPKQNENIDLKSISKLATASGTALSTMADTLEDGKIDNEERKALTKVMIELGQRVNTILSKLSE